MFLAGDVGGTKTRLALCERHGAQVGLKASKQYSSKQYQNLNTMVEEFLREHGGTPLNGAGFGVAGPVTGEEITLPNLPWSISLPALRQTCGIDNIRVVNDLVATAAGIATLGASELITLHSGSGGSGKLAAVVAPGTGMGQAFVEFGCNGEIRPFGSEGGHVDFSPTNDEELELARYLLRRFGRASVERVVCGQGLVNIFEFLRDTGRAEEPETLRNEMNQRDPAAVISGHALADDSKICSHTLDIFLRALGTHAGNLVLSYLATRAVYLGGGIPPKILPKLSNGKFIEGFCNKGRFSDLVSKVPVYVVNNDNAALLGAAQIAASQT